MSSEGIRAIPFPWRGDSGRQHWLRQDGRPQRLLAGCVSFKPHWAGGCLFWKVIATNPTCQRKRHLRSLWPSPLGGSSHIDQLYSCGAFTPNARTDQHCLQLQLPATMQRTGPTRPGSFIRAATTTDCETLRPANSLCIWRTCHLGPQRRTCALRQNWLS